jgi:hypothetical protein
MHLDGAAMAGVSPRGSWTFDAVDGRAPPLHTAADGIRRLAVGEPLDILHHDHQCQAPGRDFHGTPGGGMQIGKESIVIEGAELGTQRNVEAPLRERGLHRGYGRLWDGRI